MEVCRGVCCVGESGEGRGYPARDEGKLDVMDVVGRFQMFIGFWVPRDFPQPLLNSSNEKDLI